jgi:hypothetical protein
LTMSDVVSPSPEAKTRIQSLGQKALLEFFGEVPLDRMQQIARLLPSIAGFRKTSVAGIAKQKEALARKLTRPGASDRDYHNLHMIWRSWIDQNLPNAPLVQELIDGLEDAADAASDPDSRRDVIEKHAESLLETLKGESHQNKCAREQIERLYLFSPLPDTAATRDLIAAAKPAAEVRRDAELSELPQRLQRDESEIQSVKADLKAVADRLGSLATSTLAALGKLPEMEAAIAKVQAVAENARASIREEIGKLQLSEGAKTVEAQAAFESRLYTVSLEVGSLSSELAKCTSSLSTLTELEESIRRVAAIQKTSLENAEEHRNRIGELSSALKQIEDRIEATIQNSQLVEQVSALERRLAQLESGKRQNLIAAPGSPEAKEVTTYKGGAVLDLHAGLRWEGLQASNGTAPPAIRSCSDVASAFARVLQPLGLRKTVGKIFAEECAAAVLSRQAVFLKGTFVTAVARALARAIAGPASARLPVPIGLQDAEELRLCVSTLMSRHSDLVPAIAIEGINRSAIDATKEVLADCIQGLSNRSRRAVIFATISGGIASLPIEPIYFELGPVFDLDYLEWRTNQPDEPQPPGNALSIEIDCSLQAQLPNGTTNLEEPIRLARLYPPKRNPAIERSFTRAYEALHATRTEQEVFTLLQSLSYGWLLPYWRALDLSKDQINSELDGGKCNGPAPDPRLAAMLAAEFPGGGKPGRPT